MDQKISAKQILHDLISIKSQLKKYKGFSDKHEPLLEYILDYDFNDDYPMLKTVEREIGLSTHQLRKRLKEMYEIVFDYDKGHVLDFSISEIIFFVRFLNKHAIFQCSKLEYLPRVGDSVHSIFLRAKMGIHFFYVEKVHHEFEDSKHSIKIHLEGGFFNNYWHYRLDKALELDEISIKDRYELPKYRIKEKLGLSKKYRF